MRVKVTSTCDMNEASSVVVELLVRVQEQLRSLSNQRFNYWQVSDLLTQINSTREALANIDQNLEDATNITSGWVEAVITATQDADVDQDTEGEVEVDTRKDEIKLGIRTRRILYAFYRRRQHG